MVLLQIVANGIMNRPETDLKPTCVDIQLHFCYFSCRNFKLSVMDEVHLYIALENYAKCKANIAHNVCGVCT